MSAYYPQLPHGAGLIALSETYFETFRHDCTKRYMKMAEMMTQKKSNRPSDFIDALITLQKECKVHSIKLSEFGIQSEDFPNFCKMQEIRWEDCSLSTHARLQTKKSCISLKSLINNG